MLNSRITLAGSHSSGSDLVVVGCPRVETLEIGASFELGVDFETGQGTMRTTSSPFSIAGNLVPSRKAALKSEAKKDTSAGLIWIETKTSRAKRIKPIISTKNRKIY